MATPLDVVRRYNLELFNQRRFEIGDEILGETILRHEVGGDVVHTRAEAVQRARDLWGKVNDVRFELLHTIAEGDLVTIIFQAEIVKRDGAQTSFAGIEVFRVADGRIVEVWNHARQPGRWPEAASDQA